MELAPIGVVGEVALQGPTLFREYLSDPERTTASILDILPDWAPHDRSDRHWNRLYKSGDLCQWNPDGTLEFVSRKDTQVKIRGFRVELSEVEHYILTYLPGIAQVCVDVLETETGQRLTAFFSFSNEGRLAGSSNVCPQSGSFVAAMTEELAEILTGLQGGLKTALPPYMIPSVFIPCHFMPFITSTKLDRKALKAAATTLGQEELALYSLQSAKKREPETPMEIALQSLWSEILHIPKEAIGRDDSFLAIGGDSITAIRLMNAARSQGIAITVKDIFRDPRLSSMSAVAVNTVLGERIWETQPFELHWTTPIAT
jgi:aryl carrier-like protein